MRTQTAKQPLPELDMEVLDSTARLPPEVEELGDPSLGLTPETGTLKQGQCAA